MSRESGRDLIVLLRGRILHGNTHGCNACAQLFTYILFFQTKSNS
jgi:hypothetical protein